MDLLLADTHTTLGMVLYEDENLLQDAEWHLQYALDLRKTKKTTEICSDLYQITTVFSNFLFVRSALDP